MQGAGGPLQTVRSGPGNARGGELKWARGGPARAGRGLRRLKTRVGERVPRPEALGRGSKVWEIAE